MQINESCIFSGTTARLVQALAIQTQSGVRCMVMGSLTLIVHTYKPARGLNQLLGMNPTNRGHCSWRVVLHQCLQGIKTLCVRGDVMAINPILAQHQVQHPVEQHDVSSRLKG